MDSTAGGDLTGPPTTLESGAEVEEEVLPLGDANNPGNESARLAEPDPAEWKLPVSKMELPLGLDAGSTCNIPD